MKEKTGGQEKEDKYGPLHWVGNILGIVFIAVLLPIMIINTTLIVKDLLYPNKVPSVFGVAPLIVATGSMEDTILIDDLIFVKEVDAATLKERDIIAFQPTAGKHVVTHRITRVYEENGALMFRTKGDWNNAEDQDSVHQNQVVGLYFYRIPGLGKVADFLQQPIGMVIFVAVPLALFLVYDLLRRYFYNKKHKNVIEAEQEELERLRALAASLEQGGGLPAEPVFVAAPAVSAMYPPVEGEPGIAAAYPAVEGEDFTPAPAEESDDLDEDDEV